MKKNKPAPAFAGMRRPLAMAHRGGEGLWPPNTLYAFQNAVQLGVDVLELDIHSTADGVLVVMHDDTVDGTTDGRGPLHAYNLAELQSLDAGYRWTADGGQTFPFRGKGLRVAALEEVILAFPGLRLNIDLKQANPPIVVPFCRMLHAYHKLDQVVVGSFHDGQLREFRRQCPEVATAAGVQETRLFYLLNRLFLGALYRPPAQAFQIPETRGKIRLVTPRFIRAVHGHGLEVHVWTVNEMADMHRLLNWGVDGLITDYPDRLMALLCRQLPAPARQP